MNHVSVISALANNANTFKSVLSGSTEEVYRWKPASDKWCLLEIICHLYDEEREDFRARVKSTLSNPEAQWPKIDPLDWVQSRKYLEQDYESKVSAFIIEREN